MWAETLGYRECRLPFTAPFFAALARAADVTDGDDLLDLGSGPGEVTLGLAPYGASMTALDCEQPMLDELARRARIAGLDIRMIHARTEEGPLDLGRFRLITIGHAHWFMHYPGTFERLDRWLAPGGAVALCNAVSASANPWSESFSTIRRKWARNDLEQPKMSHLEFFRGTNFVLAEAISVPARHRVTLEDLLRRAQAFSISSPAALGAAKSEAMLAELRQSLSPFFQDGPLTEPFINQAFLYRRRGEPDPGIRRR